MHKISNLKPRLKSLIHILYRFMLFRGFFSLIYKLFYISSKPDLQMTIWKLVKGRLKEPSSFPVLDRLFFQRLELILHRLTFISPHFLTEQLDKDFSLQPPDVLMDLFVQTAWRSAPLWSKKKKRFLFFLTLFTTALHLPLHCKNGLGCKWLVHVKVFSTLILDSRYFYSREEKYFFFLSYAERQPPVLFSSM